MNVQCWAYPKVPGSIVKVCDGPQDLGLGHGSQAVRGVVAARVGPHHVAGLHQRAPARAAGRGLAPGTPRRLQVRAAPLLGRERLLQGRGLSGSVRVELNSGFEHQIY